MFGRLKNEKGKGSVIWFFCIVIFTLTWLASFLVKKTLETTKQLSEAMTVPVPAKPMLPPEKTKTPNATAFSPSGISSHKEAGAPAVSRPPSQQSQPKEIIYEPSIKENILLQ